MDPIGIFHEVKIKNNNDRNIIMHELNKVCSQTSDLVEKINNYQNPLKSQKYLSNRRKNNSLIGNVGNNIISNNSYNKYLPKYLRGSNSKKSGNKLNNFKRKIFPDNDEYKYNKIETYNYNKQYENELIGDIEKLLHPSDYNDNKNNIDLFRPLDNFMYPGQGDFFNFAQMFNQNINSNSNKSRRNKNS